MMRILSTIALAAVMLAFAANGLLSQPPDAASPAAKPAEHAVEVLQETIPHTDVQFEIVRVPAGTFRYCPPGAGEQSMEVEMPAFYLGKCEVTWAEYEVFMQCLARKSRMRASATASEQDVAADAVTRPSQTGYLDMVLQLERGGRYPAVAMSQYGAKMYCEWLSAITGQYYRLPTDAEWEYACRAGTASEFSFGDDEAELGTHGWYYENTLDDFDEPVYQQVGQKQPNAWGLHDMHGNVAEWVLDGIPAEALPAEQIIARVQRDSFVAPQRLWGRITRGGSFQDDAEQLTSAARAFSEEDWKSHDPNRPQTKWYLTIPTVGFRVLRTIEPPTKQARQLHRPDQWQVWKHPSDSDRPCR